MSDADLSLLKQAQRHTITQALDEVEQDHRAQVAFEATNQSAEASIQGEKGRLSGAAYAKIVYGATRDYIAGVRGSWRLGK